VSSAEQLERLVRNHPKLFHITRADWLCDIAASGALLPPDDFGMSTDRASWGINAAFGRKLVCLSVIPAWSIVKTLHGRELAIVTLDTAKVVQGRTVRVSPLNTWEPAATPYLNGERSLAEALDRCAFLDDRATAKVEVLVEDEIPTSTFRHVVLSDNTAADRWRPTLDAAFAKHDVQIPIRACDRLQSPRFPPDHFIIVREDVRPGVDRRARRAPMLTPVSTTPPELTDEEFDWLLEEDRAAEPRDLYDELFSDRAAAFAQLAEDTEDDDWD
jgi:hypothetical protein